MPQMSPMNWILISSLMLLSITIINSSLNLKSQNLPKLTTKSKNISWKW